MKYESRPGLAPRPRQAFVQYVDWAEGCAMTADVVIEADRAPQETGLLDAHGDPLYRVHETVPFGFRSGKVR